MTTTAKKTTAKSTAKKPATKRAPAKTAPRLPRVDLYASTPWYLDHTLPAWLALPEDVRGDLLTVGADAAARAHVLAPDVELVLVDEVDRIPEKSDRPTIVSAYGDLVKVRESRERILYFEHGVGMAFGNRHPSYPGGNDRDEVEAFFQPNARAAALEMERHAEDGTPVYIVGTPKLDSMEPRGVEGRVVVVSFHWDAKVAPESRSAFSHYKHIIPDLARLKDVEILGHSHPRPGWRKIVRSHFERFGIPFIEDFSEVLERADLYVCDNSSTIYEFAAGGRPTVALNAPWYRRGRKGALRFYDLIPGPEVNGPGQVIPAIRDVLDHPDRWSKKVEEAALACYPHLGSASQVAADTIVEHLTEHPEGVKA